MFDGFLFTLLCYLCAWAYKSLCSDTSEESLSSPAEWGFQKLVTEPLTRPTHQTYSVSKVTVKRDGQNFCSTLWGAPQYAHRTKHLLLLISSLLMFAKLIWALRPYKPKELKPNKIVHQLPLSPQALFIISVSLRYLWSKFFRMTKVTF